MKVKKLIAELMNMDPDMDAERALSDIRSDALLGADDFAYSTLDEYEGIVGFEVNEAFRTGWTMARTTNRMLAQLAPN
jgi:hypothetical protein